jgi:hypothetical protein
MAYTYTYLWMGIIFFIFWLFLFLWRKDVRKEMLIMSVIFGALGPIVDLLYTRDWWSPLTITNTAIGFESVIVGFMIGGIAAVIYEELFKKKIKLRKKTKSNPMIIIQMILISLILFLGSFYLGFNSLIASIVALSVPIIVIYVKRRDLIVDSLMTGLCLLITAFLVYSIVNLITPGWVQAFWHFTNVPNIMIISLPVDDVVWYVLAGMLIGPLYEFWQEARLVKKR